MTNYRSPGHIANRIAKMVKIIADGKLNAAVIKFVDAVTPANSFRLDSKVLDSLDLEASAGAEITFNYPDALSGSDSYVIDKNDIEIIQRLRTKKYLIKINNVTITPIP